MVLQVNGVAVDVGVIAKDADFELNNNQTIETAEKLMKIPEENLMEKSSREQIHEEIGSKTQGKCYAFLFYFLTFSFKPIFCYYR